MIIALSENASNYISQGKFKNSSKQLLDSSFSDSLPSPTPLLKFQMALPTYSNLKGHKIIFLTMIKIKEIDRLVLDDYAED